MINYNSEPVLFCKNCLSLKIRSIPKFEDSDFCDECDSTNIGTIDIFEWEKLFENKYGYNYLEGKKEQFY